MVDFPRVLAWQGRVEVLRVDKAALRKELGVSWRKVYLRWRASPFWTSFLSTCFSKELKEHTENAFSLSSLLTLVLRKEVQN